MEKCHTSEKQNSVLSFLIDMYKKQNKKNEPGMVSMYHYNIGTIVFGKNLKKTKAVSIYGLQQPEGLFYERKNFLPGIVSMYGIGHSKYCCQKEKISSFLFPYVEILSGLQSTQSP